MIIIQYKKYLSICFILLLTACGSVPQSTEVLTINTKKQEVQKFSDLTYTPYSFTEPVTINITPESQSYKFSSGQSNLMAFKITNNFKILEITSQGSGIFIPTMTIFLPTVLFLDSSFAPIKTIEPKYYYNTGKMNDTRHTMYYGALIIPEKAEYAIIYTDSTKLVNKAPMLHGGAGVTNLISAMREEYSKIDSYTFANNKVNSFVDLGYRPSAYLTRTSTGTIRLHFSK